MEKRSQWEGACRRSGVSAESRRFEGELSGIFRLYKIQRRRVTPTKKGLYVCWESPIIKVGYYPNTANGVNGFLPKGQDKVRITPGRLHEGINSIDYFFEHDWLVNPRPTANVGFDYSVCFPNYRGRLADLREPIDKKGFLEELKDLLFRSSYFSSRPRRLERLEYI